MTTGIFESSRTFKKCTAEKSAFITLGAVDLVLTLAAMHLGLSEINPVIKLAMQIPVLMLFLKVLIPVLIAWLVPGKLLIPSIILLLAVVVWNIKELLVFIC